MTTPATPTTVGVETKTCPNGDLSGETRSLLPKCNGVEYDPVVTKKFCDSRENKLYKFVVIGTEATSQTWMAENLNYNVSGGKCYGEDGEVIVGWTFEDGYITTTLSNTEIQANCNIYGRLYNWETANNTACPSGWRLPSDADWNVLMKFVNPSCLDNSDCANAGAKLKANSSLCIDNYKGTDDFGFSALPGGIYNSDGSFVGVGKFGRWWSSNGYDSGIADIRSMYDDEDTYYGSYLKSLLLSVRCLQD